MLKLKKIDFTVKRILFFVRLLYWYLLGFLLMKETISTLLITCTISIKLSIYKANKKLLFSLLIINKYYTTNCIKPFSILLIINKYYTTNSVKAYFSLLIINKYYTTNSIKSFVAIKFINLNFCRQLLSKLCITNYHINVMRKKHSPK